MGDALKAWVKASKARIEIFRARTKALLATVERYNKSGNSSEATSACTNILA